EIAERGAAEEVGILDVERPVDAELAAQRVDLLRRGADRQHEHGRIADHPRDDEHDGHDPQDRQGGFAEPAEEVADHCGLTPSRASAWSWAAESRSMPSTGSRSFSAAKSRA